MTSLTLRSKEERMIVGEALNLLKEKYADMEEQGGTQKQHARRRQSIAEDLYNRLPQLKSFPSKESDDEDDTRLTFFQNCGTSFSQLTNQSYLGTRKAGDIKVSRRFRVDLTTSTLSVKESYYFGDYLAEVYERDLGRVQNVKRHTDNPLWFAEKDGQRVEDFCESMHMGSAERDDNNVSKILASDPSLQPHIWRSYRRNAESRGESA